MELTFLQSLINKIFDYTKSIKSKNVKYLQAAQDLSAAISDLLTAAKPGAEGSRQNLLSSAGKIGDASHDILKYMGSPRDDAFQVCILFVLNSYYYICYLLQYMRYPRDDAYQLENKFCIY